MGRVAWHWRNAFQRRGHEFLEIGETQLGALPHKAFQPYRAYQVARRMKQQPDVFLVHEPLAGPFVSQRAKTVAVVVSHGLERRRWRLMTKGALGKNVKPSLRTRLLFPWWRLRSCDQGLRKSDFALLINTEDATFARDYYGLNQNRYRLFKNGVRRLTGEQLPRAEGPCRILFLGTWCARKGTESLVEAAKILFHRGIEAEWLLAGTGVSADYILKDWPEELRGSTRIIEKFPRSQESDLHAWSDVFVLPSLYEGQPLALLQAMEARRCCVVSDCCGQKDLIAHRQNGLLHHPGDPADLALELELAIENPALRLQLGRAAAASVADREWETVSDEVVTCVEQLVEQPGRLS